MTRLITNSMAGLALLFSLPVASLGAKNSDLKIADFEGEGFAGWTVEGEAFSFGPARPGTDVAEGVEGFEGEGYVNSNLGGYRLEGTLTSPEFVLERPFINFLIGGGDVGPLYVALLVDDQEVRTAVPTDLNVLQWNTWEVSSWMGQRVRVRVVDDKSGHEEGYLFVDNIYQSEQPRAPLSDTRMLFEEILSGASHNPDPDTQPTLGVWRKLDEVQLTGSFPELPGSVFDAWCYEMEGITFLGAEARSDGSVVMEHRMDGRDQSYRFRTEVTPAPGEVVVRVVPIADPGLGESLPQELPIPNLCFQLRRAEAFRSDRSGEDGKGYPGFVERCFIFTDEGLTRLDRTNRGRIPSRSADDPENNPPWVQNYVGVWRPRPEARPDSWAETSADRYVVPVIGTVSLDGEWLIALADDSADLMCQAWHDCLHTRPKWQPVDDLVGTQTWSMRIYLLPNDPDGLMDRVRADFPGVDELATERVRLDP